MPTRRRASRGLCVIALSFSLFIMGKPAMSQLPTATILGAVKDSSGAIIPGVAITAKNLETGLTRTTVGAEDGSYRFSALPVGAYEVRAEQPGFRTEVRSGLTLTVSQEAVEFYASAGSTRSDGSRNRGGASRQYDIRSAGWARGRAQSVLTAA